MRFLRKLSLKAAASKKSSGQITVFLALCFLVFLSLYLVCLQSVQKQHQRKQAEQAVEAGMFSLFSEYEPHLLDRYDLFYLDTSFGGGSERQEELCSHLWQFTKNNLTDGLGNYLQGLSLQGVNVNQLVRATVGRWAVFYRQAVQVMKEKTGADLAEDWLLQELFAEDGEENSRRFREDCEAYEGSVRDYEEEEEDEEDGESRRMDPEARQWDGLWQGFSLAAAVPDGYVVSERAVDLGSAPSVRELSVGAGIPQGGEQNLLTKQWFVSYLCEYLTQAQESMKEPREQGYLDYQLEYLIAGKDSDSENLDAVLTRLLLLREGANYLFLLSHPELRQKAEALAVLLAGMTGNGGLIKSLEQLILLGWAYGESLAEVRQLLGGYELSAVKTVADWQVPLSGLMTFLGDPGRYDVPIKVQKGISYETCLRIFLMTESWETLALRAMDVTEGELRQLEGCRNLHLDHCVERLTAQIWIEDLYLERSYGYE